MRTVSLVLAAAQVLAVGAFSGLRTSSAASASTAWGTAYQGRSVHARSTEVRHRASPTASVRAVRPRATAAPRPRITRRSAQDLGAAAAQRAFEPAPPAPVLRI
jgi:hypothetical protein